MLQQFLERLPSMTGSQLTTLALAFPACVLAGAVIALVLVALARVYLFARR